MLCKSTRCPDSLSKFRYLSIEGRKVAKKTLKDSKSSGAISLILPELKVGDMVCVGKFKNRKATIEGFGTDKNNQPTVLTDKGEHAVFKFRLQKLMQD